MMQQNGRQRLNRPSALLSPEENDLVFSLLGRGCITQSTSVVQLFTTDLPTHSSWIKRFTGIACFVRDASRRSYYIRVYCLAGLELVWEEEMYEGITMYQPREFLISFEGEVCMVGLNFSSAVEANWFYETAVAALKRHPGQNSKKSSPVKPETVHENSNEVVLRNNNQPATGMQQFNYPPQANSFGLSVGRVKKPNKSIGKLTKADISAPSNFKHVAHYGWGDLKCFDLNSEDAKNVTEILEKAHVSEEQFNDRRTRAIIYDFLEKNVLDSTKAEKQTQSPIQTQSPVSPKNYPPTPPPRTGRLSITPKTLKVRPTEYKDNSGISPPKPPPLPPSMPPPSMPAPILYHHSDMRKSTNHSKSPLQTVAPPMMDERSALMDSIRKGTTLKKIDPANSSTGSEDTRSDLMNEIQKGVELRRVAHHEVSNTRNSQRRGTDALADALRKVLAARDRDVHGSSDEDGDSGSDNDEWND